MVCVPRNSGGSIVYGQVPECQGGRCVLTMCEAVCAVHTPDKVPQGKDKREVCYEHQH